MNMNEEGVQHDSTSSDGKGLTLLRLGVWTEEMKLNMRYLASIVSDAKSELSCKWRS